MSEYLYFRVTGGHVQAAHQKWEATRNAQREARKALCEEFGADGCYATSYQVVGLVFEPGKTPPAGWQKVRGETKVYRPHGNGKGLKEIRKRLREDYPLAGASEFQRCVLGDKDTLFMSGMSIYYVVFEHVGDQLILLVPNTEKSPWTPPDEFCIPLKTSEFWALKELVNANAEAAL